MAQLSRDQFTAEGSRLEDADGEGYVCPLCDRTESGPDDVYSHLMVNHRKSALSEALLAASEPT